MELYLSADSGWTEVTPLPQCRFECGAVVLDHQLYVLGGMVCDGQEGVSQRTHDRGVERWNPDDNLWTKVASMKQQRSALAVAALNGCIYALGGYDGDNYLR